MHEKDIYLSGNDARKYMAKGMSENNGIKVCFQHFIPFEYSQYKMSEFIPGLSVLDILFNLGVDGARRVFWKNIQKEEDCFKGDL